MVICNKGFTDFRFMPVEKIHFIGLLANTDSSIENLKLEHDFKIDSFTDQEGYEFFCNLFSLSIKEIGYRLNIDYHCLNYDEKKFYFISNSIEDKINLDKGAIPPREIDIFESTMVQKYLDKKLSLMRLFKEGNICMPSHYYYYFENNKPKTYVGHTTTLRFTFEPYSINKKEISDLQKFITTTKIPFEYSYLQLAFGNFELSYKILEKHLSFLSLMMSLETLFHPSEHGELRYRISRNVATLLGKNSDKESKTIFTEVQNLYDKRSKLVHTGNKSIVKESDLPLLRYYVRESIKEIYKINKDKDDLLELLNSRGFS